jgi:hypothetical protein
MKGPSQRLFRLQHVLDGISNLSILDSEEALRKRKKSGANDLAWQTSCLPCCKDKC